MVLLYCVFSSMPPLVTMPPGIDGGEVIVVSGSDLGAAVSPVSGACLTPTVARIRTFQRVIEAFHSSRTVIPMRYGSVFATPEEVHGMLQERAEEFLPLLGELGDCVEIGIRAVLPRVSAPLPVTAAAVGGGRDYLEARRKQLRDRETLEARIASGLAGLFVKSRTECATGSQGLTSMYFLVPCGNVAKFREAFRGFSAREPAGLLLTGPWPPWNFVLQKDKND